MREKLLSYAEAYAAASLHTSPHTPLADTSAHTRYSEAGPTRAASGLGGWRCESGGGESRRARGPRGLQAPLAAQILDPVRATVVCDGPSQILALLKWFVEAGGSCGLPLVRVKNKFAMADSSEYDGYRDLMLCVLYSGTSGLRIIGEIQLHDARMHRLKLKMHKLYKVKRATAAHLI